MSRTLPLRPVSRPLIRRLVLLVSIAAVALVVPACGDDTTTNTASMSFRTLHVPKDYTTIQAAVDASKKGDLILIAPGTYHPTVADTPIATVETEDITIRGEDRNTVILDGQYKVENSIIVFSDGVAVENLTVRNNTQNGVFFTGDYGKGVTLHGYRASYVTAENNGRYGIYAFSAEDGQIDHSYGSGHPDSAYYVGQCEHCNALLTDDIAETNLLGYSGTNSTGVTIINSTFRKNRAGIVPNSEYSEQFYPNNGTTIIGNVVQDNNNPLAPESDTYAIAFGTGIVLGGVSNSLAERNLVTGSVNAGIVIADLPETVDPADKKQKSFKPEHNTVRNNTLSGNKVDLAYLTIHFASMGFGNCFEKNKFTTSFPADLETKLTCGGPEVDLGDLSGILTQLTPAPPAVDYQKIAFGPDQPNMANPKTATPVAARGPAKVDLAAITTPTAG